MFINVIRPIVINNRTHFVMRESIGLDREEDTGHDDGGEERDN